MDRYMPAYKAYLPKLYNQGPPGAEADRVLMIEITETRALAASQPPLPSVPDMKAAPLPV